MPTDKKLNSHSSHFFDVTLLKSSHPNIKKLKRDYATSIHGNKFWGSSYLLMDYFSTRPLKAGTRVLELGCGWGLASIYLSKQYQTNVTAVDADADVFPYLQLHSEINGVSVKTLKRRFEKITTAELQEFDLIIAADVCFWDELASIHFNLIRRAIKAGVKTIVYADPERAPFLELAEKCCDTFYADVFESELSTPVKARGALMVIENA